MSVEDQATVDERIPLLLETPAAVRFISVEPMLEEVDLSEWLAPDYHGMWQDAEWEPPDKNDPRQNAIDWTIVGGESGPNRRPFDVAWAEDLYRQCKEAGVAFFYKQGSGLYPGQNDELPNVGTVKEWPA